MVIAQTNEYSAPKVATSEDYASANDIKVVFLQILCLGIIRKL